MDAHLRILSKSQRVIKRVRLDTKGGLSKRIANEPGTTSLLLLNIVLLFEGCTFSEVSTATATRHRIVFVS